MQFGREREDRDDIAISLNFFGKAKGIEQRDENFC